MLGLLKMIVHAFMIEPDQLDYRYPRKLKNCDILCTKSKESCSLVIYITDSGRIQSREGDIQNFA